MGVCGIVFCTAGVGGVVHVMIEYEQPIAFSSSPSLVGAWMIQDKRAIISHESFDILPAAWIQLGSAHAAILDQNLRLALQGCMGPAEVAKSTCNGLLQLIFVARLKCVVGWGQQQVR